MAFEILNEADSVVHVSPGPPPFNRYPQAEPDKVDFDILAQGIDSEGVISGCDVTPQGAPDTTVAVAAGVVRIAGTDVAYAGGNVNCGAAHAALPRFDLIAINNAGAASAVAGVAAEPPVFPAVPANSVIVAAVWRAANDNTITAADIVDKRCMLLGDALGTASKLIGIVGGIATPNRSHHTLSAQAGAADDLDGLAVSSIISSGEIVIIRPDAGDTITVKHNALGGADARNILCIGNADIVLNDDYDFAICIYATAIGAGSWMVLGGGAAGAPHNLLDGATHPDTVAQAVSVGSLVYGDNTPDWNELIRVVPGAPALRNVLGLDQGDTVPAWKVSLDGVNPADIGVTAPGASLIYSHRDHVHAHPPGLGANLHHNEAHAAAQHNAAVLTAGFNESLGAFYMDIAQIAVPANPGAGVRRLFVDNATGEISVRTDAGATVSLEGAGGGGTLDAAYDFGGAGAGRTITADTGAVLITNPDLDAGVPNLELTRAVAYITEPILGIRAVGDAQFRFQADGNGALLWGSGAGAPDVSLSRVAANHLALAVGDTLRLQYIADTAGTRRITTAAASPHVRLATDVRVDGHLGVVTAPVAATTVYVVESLAIVAGTGRAIHVIGSCALNAANTTSRGVEVAPTTTVQNAAGMTGINVLGMIFKGTLSSRHATSQIVSVGAYKAETIFFRMNGTMQHLRGYWVEAINDALSTGSIVRASAVHIENFGHALITTSVALDIDAQSGSTNNRSIRVLGTAVSIHQPAMTIGANAAPAASAGLELQSTVQALLLNRMTTAQRNALGAVNGMLIYNTDTNVVESYEGGAWVNT